MLVSMKDMTQAALAGHYAIGQFNLNNLEWTKAVLPAAEESHAPVILGVNPAAAEYMGGYEAVSGLVCGMMQFYHITVPVALHLDHGTYEACYQAAKAGFSSLMFDGSNLPLAENLAKTAEIVHLAHGFGLSVEAEIGGVGGEEDGIQGVCAYSDPTECHAVADTGVDVLAAGIGNIHGKYPDDWPGLSFETLANVRTATGELPLALHGGTGIPEEQIKKAISMGVAKINVNTECQLAFATAVRTYIEQGSDRMGKGYDPKKLLAPGTAAIIAKVQEKIALFDSAGKA